MTEVSKEMCFGDINWNIDTHIHRVTLGNHLDEGSNMSPTNTELHTHFEKNSEADIFIHW